MKWCKPFGGIKQLGIGLIAIFIVFLPVIAVIAVLVCIILVICPICIHLFVSICSSGYILLWRMGKMNRREIGSMFLNVVINSFILSFLSYVLVRGSVYILMESSSSLSSMKKLHTNPYEDLTFNPLSLLSILSSLPSMFNDSLEIYSLQIISWFLSHLSISPSLLPHFICK